MPNPSATSTPFGGSFLLEAPPDVFTPEDLSAEHRAIAKAAEDFWTGEVEPNIDAIQHQNHHYFVDTQHSGRSFWVVNETDRPR